MHTQGSFPVYTVSAVIAVKKPPRTPLFMVAVAQQKSVQVAYLWLKSEIYPDDVMMEIPPFSG